MKKIVLTTLGIVLTGTSAVALLDHYQTIPAGEYQCPEQDNKTCTINKYKTGDIVFSTDCVEDEYSTASKYAPMIKRNQCQTLPDPGKYYLCEFADAKCNVNILSSRTIVSCTNSKKPINYTIDRSYVNHKVLQAAQTGQCKERYSEESTTTIQTTEQTQTIKKPEVQKPQKPVITVPATTEKLVKPEVQPTTPIEQAPTIQTQPVPPILPEIQPQEIDSNILENMQEQYKQKIRHQLEKEAPEYLQPTVVPVEEIPATQVYPNKNYIDADIQLILEKYENLEWEQTD